MIQSKSLLTGINSNEKIFASHLTLNLRSASIFVSFGPILGLSWTKNLTFISLQFIGAAWIGTLNLKCGRGREMLNSQDFAINLVNEIISITTWLACRPYFLVTLVISSKRTCFCQHHFRNISSYFAHRYVINRLDLGIPSDDSMFLLSQAGWQENSCASLTPHSMINKAL